MNEEKIFTIDDINKIIKIAKERGHTLIKFEYGIIPYTGKYDKHGTILRSV